MSCEAREEPERRPQEARTWRSGEEAPGGQTRWSRADVRSGRPDGSPWWTALDRCTLCHRSHPETTCTRPPLTCYGCGQPGHTRRYCPSQAGVGATAPPTRGLPSTAVVTTGPSRVPPPTGRLTVISASEAARCSDVTDTFLSLSFRCDYVLICFIFHGLYLRCLFM